MFKTASSWIQKNTQSLAQRRDPTEPHLQNPEIELYDQATIDQLKWPEGKESQSERLFLTELVKQGVHPFVKNVQTKIMVLKLGSVILPITLNEHEYDNSYVCSPYSYYIGYPRELIEKINIPLVKKPLKGFLWCISKWFRLMQINKVIIVNNWLVSTNLYPKIEPWQIDKIKLFLTHSFPTHSIIFRSINDVMHGPIVESLKHQRFKLIPNSQFFYTDPRTTRLFESRLYKSDLKLLKESGYEVVELNDLSENEARRLVDLHRSVYVEKYSLLSPHLTDRYLDLIHREGFLKLKVIKKNGEIDGVVGYMIRNRIMSCPLFGYDRKKPQELGLYRILNTILMEEARQHQVLFHQSAGASAFKKMRQAKSGIDYTAVYTGHLKMGRQFPWAFLKGIYQFIGLHFMKKY